MRKLSIFAAALVAAAAATLPGAANAITCYTVVDRSESTIYQDSQPPFDMSDAGAADRSAMRARNEFMTIADVDRCLQVTAPPGTTAYRAASVDEIVSGMRAFAVGTGTPSAAGGRTGATPAAAPARSGSTSTRKY